jgi:Kef-type K+ transport system membrane component KefB
MGAIAVIVAAGILGPLLAVWKKFPTPIVIGEIVAGILIGPQVLGLVQPGDPVVAMLHDAGFALLMFTVGLHLRLHDPALRKAAPKALLATAITALIAAPIAILISFGSDLGNPAAVAVVLATSSAALAMPVLTDAAGAELPSEFAGLAAWIVVADILTMIALPLATAQSSVVRVLLASAAVTAIAWLSLHVLRLVRKWSFWKTLSRTSKEKGWGIEMRIALVMLFALAWVGPKLGTSMLVAGFAAGLAVSAFGVSSRLTTQIVGIGEGFLIPAFFVVLGASLEPKGLTTRHGMILLAGLIAGTAVAHLAAALAVGFRPAFAFVATAQIGVPLGVVTLGQAQGWLTGEEASAFVAAAMATVAVCAFGAHRLGREAPGHIRTGVPKDLHDIDEPLGGAEAA